MIRRAWLPVGRGHGVLSAAAVGGLVLIAALSGCKKEEKAQAPELRPVRTVTIGLNEDKQTVSLTGDIRPRYEADIGFRVDGKVLARPVDVGTEVKKGTLLAKLDPQQYQQELTAATADVASADAEVKLTQAQLEREKALLPKGFTTQVRYDVAFKAVTTAKAQAEAARAKQTVARDNLGYTELKADDDGVVTAVGADAGQVVAVGQMVVRVAKPGEREAVFNVSESTFTKPPRVRLVDSHLAANPEVKTEGTVRYVSPQADPVTRTFTVRLSLPHAPDAMRLGANVVGTVTLSQDSRIKVPGTALFEKDGKPSVWQVKDGTVQLKPITVDRYEGDSVVIAEGLSQGDVVVTAGVHNLLPGQKVRLLQASAQQ